MNAIQQADQLDRLIVAACHLVASRDGVTAVYLETCRHPTYDELLRYRMQADANGLTMTLLDHGRVALRARGCTSLRFDRGRSITPSDNRALPES
jgi:hypothetical protein